MRKNKITSILLLSISIIAVVFILFSIIYNGGRTLNNNGNDIGGLIVIGIAIFAGIGSEKHYKKCQIRKKYK